MPDIQHKKIGLLGGSFNPAHEGHLHISLQALHILELDQIWWLVSPQNPLKPKEGMESFAQRFAYAKKMTKNEPKIIVSDFEQQSKTNYTFDTLSNLKEKHPSNKFVWLIGADNLVNFHKWRKWKDIFLLIPIAVFDRGNYLNDALSSKAANYFADYKFQENQYSKLANCPPPTWCFINIKKHPASSTQIRANHKNKNK